MELGIPINVNIVSVRSPRTDPDNSNSDCVLLSSLLVWLCVWIGDLRAVTRVILQTTALTQSLLTIHEYGDGWYW